MIRSRRISERSVCWLGEQAVEGKLGTHALRATLLDLLGLDHEQLTFRHSGRDFRLTDVAGHVAKEIIA